MMSDKKIINYEVIKRDLIGPKKDIYLVEFSDLSTEAQKLIKQPDCSICIKGFFSKLFSLADLEDRMKIIYGDDITIEKTITPKQNLIQKVEVENIPLNEWEGWFKEHADLSNKNQIRIMTTFFNPTNGCVTVSYVANVANSVK
jgi:hypothetical protein